MTTITQKTRHICKLLGTAPPDLMQTLLDQGRPVAYIAAAVGTTTQVLTNLLAGPDPFPTPRPANWAGLTPGVGTLGVDAAQWVGITKVAYAGPEGGYTYGPAAW